METIEIKQKARATRGEASLPLRKDHRRDLKWKRQTTNQNQKDIIRPRASDRTRTNTISASVLNGMQKAGRSSSKDGHKMTDKTVILEVKGTIGKAGHISVWRKDFEGHPITIQIHPKGE